jgi:hypothetical protein
MLEQTEDFDLICLLVDLYFPQLKSTFESFRRKNQDFIIDKETYVFRTDYERFKEDFLGLAAEGEKLKREVVDLAHRLEMFPAG